MGANGSSEIPAGTKINRLTILGLHHKDKRWRRFYNCKCDCGNEKVIQGSLILSGNTKSCGCLGKEVRKTLFRLPNNKGVINHLILQYKRHAKNRGLIFELSYDEFAGLIQKPCHYCGLPPSNNKITKNCKGFLYSGIDRVDPMKGYISDNVIPCCNMCNKAKRDFTTQIFFEWINRVYLHSKDAMAIQWGEFIVGERHG